MPIEWKKEGNACERCRKQNTEVGKMTHFKKYDLDELICQDCIEKIEQFHNAKCSNCGKTTTQDDLVWHEHREICSECGLKIRTKQKKSEKRKKAFTSRKEFWIGIAVAVIAIIVGVLT